MSTQSQRSNPLTRRRFLGEASCAALGSASVLSTLLNLKMANNAAAADLAGNDCKSLVCIFLDGGIDSFNLLVPREASEYAEYRTTRSNLALNPEQLITLDQAPGGDDRDYYLHGGATQIADMFNGTGAFEGKRKLSFVTNVGTLIQPTSLADFQSGRLPVPKALFSHNDQIQQWQTSVPQGLDQLTGWAGRAADVLHSTLNTGKTSMNMSYSGNNTFQTGQQTSQFVVTPQGALNFSGANVTTGPVSIKNQALRSMVEAQYANLFEQSLSGLTKNSVEAAEFFGSAFANAPRVSTGFPLHPLGQDLRAVAQTIALRETLGLRRQTFFVRLGGWDHHSELLVAQDSMLGVLAPAMASFQSALEELGVDNDVVSFTCSDFGRTLRSNGRGTDHAWGGNQMVFGTPVDGGKVVSTTMRPSGYPSLVLDGPQDVGRGGRLVPTTATDEFFGELLAWFGVSPTSMDSVLPNLSSFYNPAAVSSPIGFIRA
ncbi:MAG: hypothetical protein ACI9R3_000036 [Verrucomicrobiales bacterium]|jgi:uncharacterized protein (DUF1501 family)